MIGRARLGGNRSDDNVRTERFQVARLLDRRFVSHHEDALITFDRGGEGQADACVAGSCFDDRAAGFDLAFPLGGFDHGDTDAILHGKAGIEILHLGKNQRLQSFVKAIEFD